MRIPLAQMARRARPNGRRKAITLQPIALPATRATDLYRAAFLPIIEIWQNALPAIEADYRRSLAALTTDSAATLEAEIERTSNLAGAFVLGVRTRIEGWARLAEAWHRMRWRRAVQTATTIDLATLIGPQDVRETLETLIARNVALVRNVSDQTRQRIADAVFRGLQARTPPREVAKQIAGAVSMGRQRALRIAADQNVKLSSALNEERRRQAGIDSFTWVHSGKMHSRPEHVARNGKLYSEDPDKVGTEYEGRTVNRVPEDKPGELPYCGCTSRAVLILE
jgi:SPP1 gp7 family putative phage head morphogenesis protein